MCSEENIFILKQYSRDHQSRHTVVCRVAQENGTCAVTLQQRENL